MESIKRCGNFIYQYQKYGEVAIAKIGMHSNLAAQMAVNSKMFGKAEPTNYIAQLKFGMSKYPALFYKDIEEKELIKILEAD